MISRERVRKVLTHQIPDRIPNGLGGCETVGLHMIAYDELQKLLGVGRLGYHHQAAGALVQPVNRMIDECIGIGIEERNDLLDANYLKFTQSVDRVASKMIILSLYFE